MVNGFAPHRRSPKPAFLRESPPLIRSSDFGLAMHRKLPKGYNERLVHARASTEALARAAA
jgi:hypothetical protein